MDNKLLLLNYRQTQTVINRKMKTKYIINLNYLICYILLITSCFGLVSCETIEPDVDKFYKIELNVDGITVKNLDSNYKGTISADGAHFTVTGVGTDAKYAILAVVTVDGERQERENGKPGDTGIPWVGTFPKLDGVWGEIKYLTKEPPYIIDFSITPNEASNCRTFIFEFGDPFHSATITLTQHPNTE